ncbi:SPFH domain / Band 7 family protein [Polystyrenella longa]|uniref:SPFH domain / Band 7 family protein n=1 Tax=Polystyrenella longa TaxID=2528007 RepID=A0A518CGZ5_9PLAN|nr:slipin family protein [Polystyrenella longa]QDU78444.1 SPFH domain / Band 7 family protein [Polystyrenella longa]
MLKRVKIKKDEVGLLFKDDLFERILPPGTHWVWTAFGSNRVEVISTREQELKHEQIREIASEAEFGDLAVKLEVDAHKKALVWINGKLERVLDQGVYLFWNRLKNVTSQILDERQTDLVHHDLAQLIKSGLLDEYIQVVDLKDRQRALVWCDERLFAVLSAGQYAFWRTLHDIRVEVIETTSLRFAHQDLEEILTLPTAKDEFDIVEVAQGCAGVLYQNGKYAETLNSGRYVFWKRVDKYQLFQVDLRESHLDIVGQDIMTEDKVTLRMNAIVTYQVVDAVRFATISESSAQALYRAAQLVLRELVGRTGLDDFLSDKESLANQLVERLHKRAADWGLRILSAGVRDIILPGEMKDLLNRVTEAKKAAEANLISRREETAAMRSQVNTAKLLENNPTLMRLRELETLEAISKNTNLQVLLGESGLADKVVKML